MADPGFPTGLPPEEIEKISDEARERDWFLNPPADVSQTNLLSSKYNFTSRVFPLDLGDEHNAHYMVININVPVYSGLIPKTTEGEKRSAFDASINGEILNEASKVDRLRFGKNNPGGGATEGRSGAFVEIPRYTRRIAESIALFMPQSLVYSTQNAYEDISLTAIAGSIGVGAVTGLLTGMAAGKGTGLVNAISGAAGPTSRLAGYPIHPRIEIMYATTPQRQFVFEVLMAPRNYKESLAIKEIIRTLRFHAAPEIDSLTYGLTFIPPAEFDITFFWAGIENRAIPRINTCVLERIDVDVAPTGVYSTFQDGFPVTLRLSMGFREVEIVHKKRITEGF